jgi:phosphopantothenoylcysteine decarboxylase/phosphopantothenate--cysteine ligase
LHLAENPDILKTIAAAGPNRPRLVIGFAAETQNLESHAAAKRVRKNANWIVANNVGGTGIMGGTENEVSLVTETGTETWPRMSKTDLAVALAARVAAVK